MTSAEAQACYCGEPCCNGFIGKDKKMEEFTGEEEDYEDEDEFDHVEAKPHKKGVVVIRVRMLVVRLH